MVAVRRWLATLGVVAALAAGATACSPPKTPLEVGVKDVPTDVNIGAGSVPQPTTTVAAP